MPAMNMLQALNSAMDVLLDKHPETVIFGEDSGYFGGVFGATQGLQKKYGLDRVFDAPINEAAIAAMAIGMAAKGLKPIAEIQFADYIFPAFDQIISEMSRLRYRSAGQFVSPVVVRSPWGGGIRGGQTHSMSPEAFFTHIPGVKVAVPSNPYDAKGMLIAASEGDDPVIFFEPKRIYNGPFDGVPDAPLSSWAKHPKGEVPEGHYRVELGKAEIVREGEACTVVTYGTLVHVAVNAAEKAGIDAEIIDLKTLAPYDIETIVASVNKTGRVVVAHEAPRTSGFGAELAAQIQEECFYALEAPVFRLTGWDTPYPHAHEWAYFPGQARFIRALQTVTEAR
ncbi:2-oxoisovalerate dehydrogenase subunit beta [Glycocaulis albus]|uniref:3-methyl-2-oxobutanoate dehydrogenase (2-methylpropanoyl-transferring) n=1 Tax=Glycocaulis albus TaxID=1382801 RepID=A0ABQ1XLS0_9PROT|nr:alpha-ketoacid dehydrogenase subunit beta [Glycocaulis albus]GGG97038.1 2-oxoisovalerate dehydrogenase subunit beta [Glycocaulis albus]